MWREGQEGGGRGGTPGLETRNKQHFPPLRRVQEPLSGREGLGPLQEDPPQEEELRVKTTYNFCIHSSVIEINAVNVLSKDKRNLYSVNNILIPDYNL